MSQLTTISSPASGREMIERAAMLRRTFYPQGKMPRIKIERIPWRIVYAHPIEIEWPRPRPVYLAPIGPQLPTAIDLAVELDAVEEMCGRRIKVIEIVAAAAEHFGIGKAELLSHRRARRIVRPRQVVMYLAKEITSRSLPEIGRLMQGRDHTTVLHGHRKIRDLIAAGDPIASDVEAIRARLLA